MRIGLGHLSLSQRLMVSVGLALALILLLYGTVAVWSVEESTQTAYKERIVLAETLAEQIDHLLGRVLASLESEAETLALEPGGTLGDEPRQRLTALRREIGYFVTLAVVAPDGTVVGSEPAQAAATLGNPVVHPILGDAIRTGASQVGELTSRRDDAAILAGLAAPLRTGRGELAGALVATVDPDHPALNLLLSGEVGDGMPVQLVNMDGRRVAGAAETSSTSAAEHRLLLGGLMASATSGYRIHEPSPPARFPSHFIAYAPVPRLPSWGITVEQPKGVVLAVPSRLRERLAVFGLAALLAAVAVAWLDGRRIVRPLRQLTTAAERFAAGQLDEPVVLRRGDELGILARAFETMRQRLSATLSEVERWNQDLEQRVAARTAEIEHLNERLLVRDQERGELLQRLMSAQEEERRRIAQELHDETSQALTTLQLGLERLASHLKEQPAVQSLAGQLQGVAAQTLADVHRIAVELRPSVLDDIGLVPAIERYLHECARRWDLVADFIPVGIAELRLFPAAETAIYRMVQAALTNVAQHAGAQHASVLIERRDDLLIVIVEDDGRGFDLQSVRTAGIEDRLGLAGMEERASLIGATLTVETSPGAGTTVFLEVPLERNCQQEESDGNVPHGVGR